MKRGFERTQRIADLIQKALAPMLLQYVEDDRFSLVTITGVTVTRDIGYAKVYVSVLLEDEAEIKDILKSLNHEAKALRYNLAHAVDLRVVPELKFIYDSSTASGFRISSLIDSAMTKSDKKK